VVTYPFLHSNPILSQVPGLTVWGSSARFVSTGINPWQARTLQISNEKKLCSGKWGWIGTLAGSHAATEAVAATQKIPRGRFHR
jgi:hypothetical protein